MLFKVMHIYFTQVNSGHNVACYNQPLQYCKSQSCDFRSACSYKGKGFTTWGHTIGNAMR